MNLTQFKFQAIVKTSGKGPVKSNEYKLGPLTYAETFKSIDLKTVCEKRYSIHSTALNEASFYSILDLIPGRPLKISDFKKVAKAEKLEGPIETIIYHKLGDLCLKRVLDTYSLTEKSVDGYYKGEAIDQIYFLSILNN